MTPAAIFRLSAILSFIVTTTALAAVPDVEAAAKDRAAHFAAADWPSIAYLTLHPWAGEPATDLEQAIKLMVASDTTQPVIERSVPVKIQTGLYRIDLRDLNWQYKDWELIARDRNPYCVDGNLPLVIRADWFLLQLADRQESDTYDRLIFGGDKIPKNKQQVLDFFKIQDDPGLTFGLIEGQSGVSVQGTRRIASLPIPRGYAWITSDVFKLDENRDPVEHPDGVAPFDGQETIIGLPKLSTSTGKRGALQWYFLNNGKTEALNRAAVDLVRDSTHFRGLDEIRRPGSCVQCHAVGLNPFTRNEFRELLKSGVKVFAKEKDKSALEAFHLSDLKTEISRANDDFQTMVVLVTGAKTSDEAIKSFTRAVNRYDNPLSLEETASELYLDVATWTRVLATTTDLPGRFAALPHGGRIPRVAWEQTYRKAWYASHGGQPIQREQNAEQKAQAKAEPPPKPVVIEKKPDPKPAERKPPRLEPAGDAAPAPKPQRGYQYLPPINYQR